MWSLEPIYFNVLHVFTYTYTKEPIPKEANNTCIEIHIDGKVYFKTSLYICKIHNFQILLKLLDKISYYYFKKIWAYRPHLPNRFTHSTNHLCGVMRWLVRILSSLPIVDLIPLRGLSLLCTTLVLYDSCISCVLPSYA